MAMPIYSPTSPAALDADWLPTAPTEVSTANRVPRVTSLSGKKEEEDPLGRGKLFDTTENAFGDTSPQRDEEEDSSPNPRLFVGYKLSKLYTLKPNRWIQVGRSKKTQLHLDNPGVSRHHCSIRWDQYRKVVELRDSSYAGTLVNGETVRGQRRALQHGDRVGVEGRGMRYEFVLDLRPINPVLGDPRKEQGARDRLKAVVPHLRKRKQTLKDQLSNLDKDLARVQKSAFAKEAEFYEIMTRRRLRAKEDEHKKRELAKYIAGEEEMELKLQESREEWFEKLQENYDSHDGSTQPVIDEVGNLQVKVDKLQLKRDELLRSIHPERYAVADVSRVGSVPLELPTPTKTGSDVFTASASMHASEGASRDLSEPAASREQSPPRAAVAIEDGLGDDDEDLELFGASTPQPLTQAADGRPELPIVDTQHEVSAAPSAGDEPDAKRLKIDLED